MRHGDRLTRRNFLRAAGATCLAAGPFLRGSVARADEEGADGDAAAKEDIVDIHQHTDYHGRSDEDLVAHQRALGVTVTVLLPAGSKHGLAAGCGGNATVHRLAKRHPDEFVFFANELPQIDGAREVIGRWLDRGAIGIGEQKFRVPCDSEAIEGIAQLAKERGVPVLLHFQHEAYNTGIERFHRILEKYPEVDFIGHAQTWWGHIDRKHDPEVMYPKGEVTPGGITDRLLSEHPNMYGDLSAGSGLNSLLRDEKHARGFLDRHRDKLLFGSDCADTEGRGEGCTGARILAAVRRLAPDAEARGKILSGNARRILDL